MKANIVLLPGDGIGPEVIAEAVRVLDAVAQSSRTHASHSASTPIGGCSIDRYGIAADRRNPAGLPGGGCGPAGRGRRPQWDDPLAKVRPEQGLLGLRKGLGVFANLRPVTRPSQPGSPPRR